MENMMMSVISQLQADDKLVPDQIGLPASTPEIKAAGAHLSELLSASEETTVYSIPQISPSASDSTKASTLGDAILRRMDSLGTNFRNKVDHVYEMLKVPPGTYSAQQMLQLQMGVSMISIEVEVVGKGVQKAVQHADQLTKLQ